MDREKDKLIKEIMRIQAKRMDTETQLTAQVKRLVGAYINRCRSDEEEFAAQIERLGLQNDIPDESRTSLEFWDGVLFGGMLLALEGLEDEEHEPGISIHKGGKPRPLNPGRKATS